MPTLSLMLSAAKKVLDVRTALWELEKAKLDGLLKHGAGIHMPDNFWQPEHTARRKMEVAAAVVEAVMEVIHENRLEKEE